MAGTCDHCGRFFVHPGSHEPDCDENPENDDGDDET